jgi:hypothetical protein
MEKDGNEEEAIKEFLIRSFFFACSLNSIILLFLLVFFYFRIFKFEEKKCFCDDEK